MVRTSRLVETWWGQQGYGGDAPGIWCGRGGDDEDVGDVVGMVGTWWGQWEHGEDGGDAVGMAGMHWGHGGDGGIAVGTC